MTDYYRVKGTTQVKLSEVIKDSRLMYMYAWRKITSGSYLSFFYKIILNSITKHRHIEIPYTVKIGHGFSMDHAYNITINSKVKIGNNVTMFKGSTIGQTTKGVPIIGNNVYIGLNSTIVGDIIIGDDVVVAPNSFVNISVPSHSVVIGNPAIIHEKMDATKNNLWNVYEDKN